MFSNKPKTPSVGSGLSLPGISMPKPMATGTQSTTVKTPKPKSMPKADDKPSKFFKSEEIKSVSVRKLHDFVNRKRKK